MLTTLKTPSEIEAMKEGGRMLATVLELMKNNCAAGMTPKQMSNLARSEMQKLGAQPAFLGFEGYPDVICISVNDRVQHAIPDNRPFELGDVVNFDFGVRHKGLITDAGITVCVGDQFTPDTRRLINGTKKALEAGLQKVRAGVHVGDVSAAIEQVLRKNKLGIVRELVGHGVGHNLHEEPEIPNYGSSGRGPVLRAGMTIAIEPIATLGDFNIHQLSDGWTLVTRDGSLAAQFEHTVVVTDKGAEILTTL